MTTMTAFVEKIEKNKNESAPDSNDGMTTKVEKKSILNFSPQPPTVDRPISVRLLSVPHWVPTERGDRFEMGRYQRGLQTDRLCRIDHSNQISSCANVNLEN